MSIADPVITVVVNGQPRPVPSGHRLSELLEAYGAGRGGIAVAVDGEVVPRAGWPGRELADGARIEILTAVQGG